MDIPLGVSPTQSPPRRFPTNISHKRFLANIPSGYHCLNVIARPIPKLTSLASNGNRESGMSEGKRLDPVAASRVDQ